MIIILYHTAERFARGKSSGQCPGRGPLRAKGVYAACAAALADEVLAISFEKERKRSEKALRSFLPLICCPARTADKRAPRPPSCQSPPPKAFPALGIHPASGITSLLVVKRCSISHNASSFQDYREIHQVSQLEAQEIRSLSDMQFARVSPFSFAEARGAAGKC